MHSEDPRDLMYGTLDAGVRRNPEAEGGWQLLDLSNPPRRVRAIDTVFAEL